MDPNQPMPPSSPMQSGTVRPTSSSAPVQTGPRPVMSAAPVQQNAIPRPATSAAPMQQRPMSSPASVQNGIPRQATSAAPMQQRPMSSPASVQSGIPGQSAAPMQQRPVSSPVATQSVMPASTPAQGSSPQPTVGGTPQTTAPQGSGSAQTAGTSQVGGTSQQQQHHQNNANDLYSQITAEDEEIVVTPQKKTTPLISTMAVFMKVTFWTDEFRRSHERLFILLHTIWACIMGILYFSGSVTLFLSVSSFMQLPIYMEKYFSERGIQYDSLDMSDYSFSKINVTNLRDKDNTYTIPEITVHSTFADFLQNRIRMVEASDLNLNISIGGKDQTADFDLIIKLLQAFSEPKKTGLELDVNTVRVNNAVLNIKTKNRSIPVSFSLSGTYTKNNELIVPFSVNEDFLKMDAKLTITGPESDRKVNIRINDKTGFLTLPQRPTEQLKGNISVEMKDHKIQNVTVESQLNYANSLKTIRANLQNSGQDTFNGSLLFTMGDSSDGSRISSVSTDVTFNFRDLIFTPDRQLKTDKPLQISLRKLAHKNTIIEGGNTTLTGTLLCLIDQASCTYSLKEKALLQMSNMQFDVRGHAVRFSQKPALTILPNQKESMKLQLNSPYFQMEAPFENVKLTGVVGEGSEDLLFDANTVNLQMAIAQKASDTHFRILVQNANYLTSDLSIERINMLINDYFDETSKIQFSAYSVQTGSELLTKPVSLEITNVGEQTAIQAQIVDTNVVLNAQGYFDPFKFAFIGRFAIPATDLGDIPFALSEISSAFPKNISKVNGKIAASGQLKFNGASSIAGPLYLGLRDVSFDWDNTQISGINGVLGLQSLAPLATANNQKLFVQNVLSFIPISNLLFQFSINNQSLRLASVSGQIGGQDVIVSSSLIPLKDPDTGVSLRTARNFDLSNLNPYFDLPGISLKNGEGSFNIPVSITDKGVNLGDLTMKILNATWQKDENQSGVLNIFGTGDTAYTVRSGQLILNPKQQLQVATDGWLLPSKEKNSFGPETISLTKPLFKQSPKKDAPVDIQKLQDKFGL